MIRLSQFFKKIFLWLWSKMKRATPAAKAPEVMVEKKSKPAGKKRPKNDKHPLHWAHAGTFRFMKLLPGQKTGMQKYKERMKKVA
jgi:hypothetical protein